MPACIYVWIGREREKLCILSVCKDKLFQHQQMKSLHIFVSKHKCKQECGMHMCKV